MKLRELFKEIMNAVVGHERKKAREGGNEILNQKKTLWYGLMNQIDEEQYEEEKET